MTPRTKPSDACNTISDIRAYRLRTGENQTVFWSTFCVGQSRGSRYERGRNMPRAMRILIGLRAQKVLGDATLQFGGAVAGLRVPNPLPALQPLLDPPDQVRCLRAPDIATLRRHRKESQTRFWHVRFGVSQSGASRMETAARERCSVALILACLYLLNLVTDAQMEEAERWYRENIEGGGVRPSRRPRA